MKPEKWDALTRSWKRNILGLGVDLLLLDEIHHVGEDRGWTLEMVVIRTQSISDAYFESSSVKELDGTFPAARLRIVALSATLPNIVDIGTWLQCSTDVSSDHSNLLQYLYIISPQSMLLSVFTTLMKDFDQFLSQSMLSVIHHLQTSICSKKAWMSASQR